MAITKVCHILLFTCRQLVNNVLDSCKTLDQMRTRVPALRSSLSADEDVFKRVYMYTFALARSQGQKSLPLEAAAEYWKLLLNKRFEAQLPIWIEFLEKEYRKAISKDTWNCMYDFVQLARKDPELKTYDVDGLFCSVIPRGEEC